MQLTCMTAAVEYAFEPLDGFYDILEEARGKGGSTTEAVSRVYFDMHVLPERLECIPLEHVCSRT